MKLNPGQLSTLLGKIHLLTESGYPLLESIALIREHTTDGEYLPISRIWFDLKEGYSHASAIEMNSEPLSAEVLHALYKVKTDGQFCQLLPAILPHLKAA